MSKHATAQRRESLSTQLGKDTDNLASNCATEHLGNRSDVLSEPVFVKKLSKAISRYRKVLFFLSRIPSVPITYDEIASHTKIPNGTVRRAVVWLEKNTLINKSPQQNRGGLRGLFYEMKQPAVGLFLEVGEIPQRGQPSNRATEHVSYFGHEEEEDIKFNNYSLTKNITKIALDPEAEKFWGNEGVTIGTIKKLHREIEGVSVDELLESFTYSAFDFLYNDIQKKQSIKKNKAWLEGYLIKEFGMYPMPPNYKSFKVRQAKLKIENLQQEKEILEELRNLQQHEADIKLELLIHKTIESDPEQFSQWKNKIPCDNLPLPGLPNSHPSIILEIKKILNGQLS